MSDHPIAIASFAQIDAEIGPHSWNEAEYAIVRRAIHSTADFELAQQFVFSPGAIAAGITALQSQTLLIVDVHMVAVGIQPGLRREVAIAQAPSPVSALTLETTASGTTATQTRTAAGMQALLRRYPEAVVVVGNAPTALLAVVEAIQQGWARPPLVIGVPVGFVAVSESKVALTQAGVPYITIRGRKGGSAVAAAIVNALWRLAGCPPPPTPDSAAIQVVGMGLAGWDSLAATSQRLLQGAAVIAGSGAQLALLPPLAARQQPLEGSVNTWLETLQAIPERPLAILTSGDPLFYGLGRLLQQHFRDLSFHPAVSSVQLACARLGLPLQSAEVISIHGREPEALLACLKRYPEAVVILTDASYPPLAIATLLEALHLPVTYQLWLCSRLGAADEQVLCWHRDLAPLPEPLIMVLRQVRRPAPAALPQFGIADRDWLTFVDQPGLLTKQPLRCLTLGLLQLPATGVFWDVGAGIGSVAIEMARLSPQAQVYAIETVAIGVSLIQQNCTRFGVTNVSVIEGRAPAALAGLPAPDRVFVGGGGRDLAAILATCHTCPVIVVNCATLEACLTAQTSLSASHQVSISQVMVNQSAPLGQGTRFAPLNPVWLVQASRAPTTEIQP